MGGIQARSLICQSQGFSVLRMRERCYYGNSSHGPHKWEPYCTYKCILDLQESPERQSCLPSATQLEVGKLRLKPQRSSQVAPLLISAHEPIIQGGAEYYLLLRQAAASFN